jgi:hypothetical protein
MKKIITLSAMLVTLAFSATFASAQSYFPQRNNDRYDQNRRNDRSDNDWRNKRARTVTQTRIVRQGFRTYRETIQIKYLPNGRTQTKVISRTRIR